MVVGAPGLSAHYELVLTRDGALDVLTVRVEASHAENSGDADLGALGARIAQELSATLGIGAHVQVERPGALVRSEGKAVRLVDRRG